MKFTEFVLLEPYYKYLEFLNTCKDKEYDEALVLHSHHIIPEFMGGKNDKTNLVKLSVSDHATAHILFAYCFEVCSYEYIYNLRSSRFLEKKSIRTKDELYLIQQTYIGENNPFYGKKHTQESLIKISQKTGERSRGKIYEELYNKTYKEEREKRKEGVKKHWESMSDEEIQTRSNNISKSLKGNTPWNKGKKSSYMVDGIIYENMNSALEFWGYKFPKKLRDNHTVIKI